MKVGDVVKISDKTSLFFGHKGVIEWINGSRAGVQVRRYCCTPFPYSIDNLEIMEDEK